MWGLSLRKEEGRRGAEQDESSAVRNFQEGFRPEAESCSHPALVGSGASGCWPKGRRIPWAGRWAAETVRQWQKDR